MKLCLGKIFLETFLGQKHNAIVASVIAQMSS